MKANPKTEKLMEIINKPKDIKSIIISIRVTKNMKKFMTANRISPSLLFEWSLRQIGFEG